MNTATIFIVSLGLSLILSFVTKINTGYFAMGLAFLNGVFIYNTSFQLIEEKRKMYRKL